MAKFCENCGFTLGEGKKYCPVCGAPAAPSEQPPVMPEQPAYASQQTRQPNDPQPAPAKKKKGKGVLIAVIALIIAAGVGTTCFFFFRGGEKTQSLTITPETPKVTSETGVSVEIDPCLLQEGDALVISVKEAGTETAENGDYRITAYDISAGDLHDLGTYVQIRIPYDGTFCQAGSDPAKFASYGATQIKLYRKRRVYK